MNTSTTTAAADNGSPTTCVPREGRMFIAKPAADWISEARLRPDPVRLWRSLWFENEVACLFADTNMGKSIYAVQIASEVARDRKVLYFDFELSDKQFQMRYTDEATGATADFDPKFIRVEFSQDTRTDILTEVIANIEMEVRRHGAYAVIIDNITWICNRSESGDAAGELMQMLINLKRRLGLSILVLAHTPKRAVTSALTQNSLAGSKKIANFMDSMFAIGLDRKRIPAGRYIKQIKVRSSELEHGENAVIRCSLVKEGPMLHFAETGSGIESELLMGDTKDDREDSVVSLYLQATPQREIARQLKMSLRDVSAMIRRYRNATEGEIDDND